MTSLLPATCLCTQFSLISRNAESHRIELDSFLQQGTFVEQNDWILFTFKIVGVLKYNTVWQGCINDGRQVLIYVAPNICGSSVWDLIIILQERRILWCLRYFGESCGPCCLVLYLQKRFIQCAACILKMETGRLFGVLIPIHEGTRRHILSHCNIDTHCIGNIVSCIKFYWNLVGKIEGFSVHMFI